MVVVNPFAKTSLCAFKSLLDAVVVSRFK